MYGPPIAMIFVAAHLATFLLVVAGVLGAGLPVASRDGSAGVLERLSWGAVWGLLILGHACFALALCGALGRPVVAALGVAALMVGGRPLLALATDAAAVWRSAPSRRRWVVGVGAGLGLTPLVLFSFYPPHAWDETIYHLPMARAFAESGAMPFLERLRMPVFPAIAELLDAAILTFADDVSTHAIACIATLATAGLLVGMARVQGSLQAPPARSATASGWVAASVHLGTPMVIYLAGLAYVDALLTLWVTASMAAWQRARGLRSRRWLLACGLLAGSAASVKYLGLFVLGWLGFEILCRWGGGWRARCLATSTYAVGAGVALPTYARITYSTGNPLFPFYAPIFGRSPWTYEFPSIGRGLHGRLLEALLLPWQGAFERARVGSLPPLSPFWLAAALILLVAGWKSRAWRWTLAMALGYSLTIPAHSRYLMPLLPLVGLAGATLLLQRVALRRSVLFGVCIGLALPGWLYAVSLSARRGPLPTTGEERRAFLIREVAGYPTVDFLNRLRGADYTAYGLHLETMHYYAAGGWLGDVIGTARYPIVEPLLADPSRLEDALRGFGAQYFVAPRRALPPGFVESWQRRPIFADDGYLVWDLTEVPAAR